MHVRLPSSLALFSLQHGKQTHDTEHNGLEPWVFRKQDGYVSHKRYVSHDATDNVLALEIVLATGVQLHVVGGVVVTLGEEFGLGSAGRLAMD